MPSGSAISSAGCLERQVEVVVDDIDEVRALLASRRRGAAPGGSGALGAELDVPDLEDGPAREIVLAVRFRFLRGDRLLLDDADLWACLEDDDVVSGWGGERHGAVD